MSDIPTVYSTGMNNAAEFVASGWPYAQRVTGGSVVTFPWVTNEIYLTNDSGATMYVGFTAAGVTSSNRIPVLNNVPLTLRIKATKLYTSGSTSGSLHVAAALTNITPAQYPTLVPYSTVVHNPADETLTKKYPGV